jgi:hypothetical protein
MIIMIIGIVIVIALVVVVVLIVIISQLSLFFLKLIIPSQLESAP